IPAQTNSDALHLAHRRRKTAISLSFFTSSLRSRALVKRRLTFLTASFFEVVLRQTFAARSCDAATSRGSSACQRTFSTAPASPPAFSFSTKRTAKRARASL